MEVIWLPRVIAHHPYRILLLVFVFSALCLVVPFTTRKLPDFSDPQLGFEARGTVLSQRFVAWQNLMEESKARGSLTDNPLEYYWYLQGRNQKKSRNRNPKKGKKYVGLKSAAKEESADGGESNKWEELLKLRNRDRVSAADVKSREGESSRPVDYFCNSPSPAYARVVIASDSEVKNLWSVEGVLAQCHIDGALRANRHFPSLCQTDLRHGSTEHGCCRSWSPANYVALLSNRSSCLGVTENDLLRVESLLRRCLYYYRNLQLTADCAENPSCQLHVPTECYAYDAPYHLLHYLLEFDFLSVNKNDSSGLSILRSAMLFLPIAASSATLDFYRELKDAGTSYGEFSIRGMQLGLKSTLFDKLLVSDSVLLLIGFSFVTICIWIYTGSTLTTAATILAVLFSLGISYAVYTLALRINFFPFMNLLTVVVAVGIGADDAFIYCKVWDDRKRRKSSDTELADLVRETMKHAVPSMLVTTLTTTVAFLASIVSNVTAINCFSLFSGITVIANFFLMITWLPACVVISEYCRVPSLPPASCISRKIVRPLRLFAEKTSARFTGVLTRAAIGFRWLWLTGLGTVAVAACIIVFYCPGLQVPDSPNFQLFDASHPFERYDLIYSRRFWFEKIEMGEGGDVLPLRFVWGVKPVDNGNYLDPGARGSAVWDESFDVSDPESQVWLLQFCRKIRGQPFYRSTLGPLLTNCFVESLYSWMQRGCLDPLDRKIGRAPCCSESRFPYAPNVLRQCAAEANAELHRTPSYLWSRNGIVAGGVKFFKELSYRSLTARPTFNGTSRLIPSESLPRIKVLIVEYDSTYADTLSFAKMDQFYREIEAWMQEQLRTAPLGMRGGWFVSRLEFYELQRTLYHGTLWAMGISLGLALTVLALITLNPLVSLLAVVAMGASILVTIAALVLLGWKLNVLESVAISTAIGLAVDFSLHYGVSYRTSDCTDRRGRTRGALEQMGGPTLMAAITSGAAGAFMLPSNVLAYIQIGVFLLLIMGISWTYATFFLCPLLAVAGPSPHFAQFHFSRARKLLAGIPWLRKESIDDVHEPARMDDRVGSVGSVGSIGCGRGILSESTLSTSSTACQLHSSEFESPVGRPSTHSNCMQSSSLPGNNECFQRSGLFSCFRKGHQRDMHGSRANRYRARRKIRGWRGMAPEYTTSNAGASRSCRGSEAEALNNRSLPCPRRPSPSSSFPLLSTSSSNQVIQSHSMKSTANEPKETDVSSKSASHTRGPIYRFPCDEPENLESSACPSPPGSPSFALLRNDRRK